MGNTKKKLWVLIIIIVILFMASPRTIRYLRAKTDLIKGETSVVKEIEIPHSDPNNL